MPKEILLYTSIYSFSAADFITALEAAKDDDVIIRINTPGGEVYAAYGMIAKLNEHSKKVDIKVDGRADSGGAFMCCYAENVECLDVSTFLFHRAAMSDWIESNPEYFTEDLKAALTQMNGQLRAAMEGKFTAETWLKVTGVSLDDLFSLDSRIDVVLDAKQAKKLGLVNKITAITPAKKAEIESQVLAIAALSIPKDPKAVTTPETPIKKINIMTLAEFKAAHPAIYAEAVQEGVTDERERVGGFMVYAEVDPAGVAKAIEDGSKLTPKAMAQFNLKAMSKAGLKTLEGESPAALTTGEAAAAKTTTDAATAAFEAAVDGKLGLAKK